MSGLRISADLTLPLDWITLSTVIYGARGSGKTTLGRVMAEEAFDCGQRFCAIDLKGDWWGLKSSADGQSGGIPVVIFGGDRADLPLEPGAGTFVAETVAALHQPVILDLEHLSKGKQIAFLTAFFERLYDANREPLLLLLDEAQRYAPQRPMNPDAARCLGAVEDLVKLGRKHGIGPVLFTQRGSGLNKEVSELCDLLVAFRTPGPLDQDRIKDWLDANATREQRDTVMGALASMPTGTAVFASGHPGLRVFQTSAVRMPRTFDSSATPKIGTKPKAPKILAATDIAALREKMADAIERIEANDPKKLRARVTDLERQLAVKPAAAPAPPAEIREVPVLQGPELTVLSQLLTEARALVERIERLAEPWAANAQMVAAAIGRTTSTPVQAPAPRRAPVAATPMAAPVPRAAPAPSGAVAGEGAPVDLSLAKVERAILTVLAQWPEGRSATEVGLIAGYSSTAGGFRNGVGSLRSRGLVEGQNGHLVITEAGHAAVGPVEPAPTGRALFEMWLGHKQLGKAERAILTVLVEAYPSPMSNADVGAQAQYSHTAGGFRNALGRLRTLRLITGSNAAMVASPDLI